jgi:hypothetical protein
MRLPDGRLVVHLVNYDIGGGKLTPAENVEVRIALGDSMPQKVTLLSPDTPEEKKLDAIMEKQNGENYVLFTVPRICIYDLVAIDCSPA